MRVAIYVRVSTQEQAESGYSIDEQIDKLKTYASIRDWNVVEIYNDAGFSGSNINRPSMQRLIADAYLKKFDSVLVYKLDRLSRSQKDTLYLIEDVLLKNNINFVSLSENFDTDSPFGKAMIGMLAVFAQLEREQITERMKMGKLGRAKSGKYMSFNRRPFGYDMHDTELTINELEASIVRSMFDMYESGVSINGIVKKLNDDGHIAKDKKWSYRVVRQTLDNPVHAGRIKYLDNVFDGNHEPIISPEQFDRVAELIESRSKKSMDKFNNHSPFKAKYMLTGFIKCGYCGSNFHYDLYQKRKGEAVRKRVYGCYSNVKHRFTNKAQNGCEAKKKEALIIEHIVIDEMNKLKANQKHIKPLKDTLNLKLIDKELSKVVSKIERLSMLFVDGKISSEKYNEQFEVLTNQKNSLQEKLIDNDNVQNAKVFNKALKTVKEMPKDFGKLKTEQQRVILSNLVDKILVYNDKVEFFWKFDTQI